MPLFKSVADTRLHHALPVSGQKHNRYCGPAALAALIGISTGEAASRLRAFSGKRAIMGVHEKYMVDCLEDAGMPIKRCWKPDGRITLGRWIKEHYAGDRCLVIAGNHYWAIDNYYYVDSFFKMPNPITTVHMPKCQLEQVFHLP